MVTFPNKPAPGLTIEGSPSSNGQPPRLPVYVRYRDLVEANIVRNWPQLLRLIAIEGFPRGVLLSPNARAWGIGEVRDWLASRPQAGQVGARLRAAFADREE